jgi:hypothetical protein
MNTLQFLHEKVSKKLALIYDTVLRIINRAKILESTIVEIPQKALLQPFFVCC